MIRRIGIELFFPGDLASTSVTELVVPGSTHLSGRLINDSKTSVLNTLSFSVRHAQEVVDKIRMADKIIEVRAWNLENRAPLFRGVIEPNASQSSHQINEAITLEAVDMSYKLDEPVAASFQYPSVIGAEPLRVCDHVTPGMSIFHQVSLSAGYTLSDIAGGESCVTVVEHCAAKKGGETYRAFLNGLLSEYGLVVDTDELGRLIVKKWSRTDNSYDEELDAGDLSIVEPVTWTRRYTQNDGAKIEWSKTAVMYQALLYRDSLPVSSDGEFTGTAIASGDYYPADSDIQETYQDFVEKWLDTPYLSRQTRLQNEDISLISTSDHDVVYQADDGVELDAQGFESHRAAIRFRNASAATQNIYAFEIRGTALYRDSIRSVFAPRSSTNPMEITTRFVFDQESADALANAHALDIACAGLSYSFGLNRYLPTGRIIRLRNAKNGIDAIVLVTEIDYEIGRPVYRYRAIALAEYVVLEKAASVSSGMSSWIYSDEAERRAALNGITLAVTPTSISRNRAGVLSPSIISLAAIRRAATAYSGRFTIELSRDGGSTYQAPVYISAADESNKAYTVPASMVVSGITYYVTGGRVRLYAAGGTTIRIGETLFTVSLDSSTAVIYWGRLSSAPSVGIISGDYYLDNRAPTSGGGKLRLYIGSVWVEYINSMSGYAEAKAKATLDIVAYVADNASAGADVVAIATALIVDLWAYNLSVGKSLRAGGRYSTTGSVESETSVGVFIGATGLAKFGSPNGEFIVDPIQGRISISGLDLELSDSDLTTYAGVGLYRRAMRQEASGLLFYNAPSGQELSLKGWIKRQPIGIGKIELSQNVVARVDSDITPVEHTISATSRVWSNIAWSPELGLFCMVASGSTVCATSPDGSTWTERKISVTSRNWSSITWSPELGLFCAVAKGSTVCATSPNGITWTERIIHEISENWSCVTWSPELGLFCMVAEGSMTCAISGNGVKWIKYTTNATSRVWANIAWSPELGLFCMVASGSTVCATSPNGITWTERTISATSRNWSAITWSPERRLFCMVAESSTVCATSPNGITWTERIIHATSRNWHGITWSPELGLFCTSARGFFICATSPDGITWTIHTISTTSRAWSDIAWSPELGLFCSVAESSTLCVTITGYQFAQVGAGVVSKGRDTYGAYEKHSDGKYIRIDPRASIIPNEIADFILSDIDVTSIFEVYKTSGTFTWTNPQTDPDDKILIIAFGGGGGAGDGDTDDAGSGGGAGAGAVFGSIGRIDSLSFTVGALGTGGGATASGSAGGKTLIAGLTLGGGGGGSRGGVTQSGGAGGVVSGTLSALFTLFGSSVGGTGGSSGNGSTGGAGGTIWGTSAFGPTAYQKNLYGVAKALGYGVYKAPDGTSINGAGPSANDPGCGGAAAGQGLMANQGGNGAPGMVLIIHTKLAPMVWFVD